MTEDDVYPALAEAAEAGGGTWATVMRILDTVRDLAIEQGCEHRQAIEDAAERAIDVFVSIDLPRIPDIVERMLDRQIKTLAMQWVDAGLDSICGEDEIGDVQ